VESGAAEHLALEHFDPIDVTFDSAGVPGLGETCNDRGEVALEAGGEVVQFGEVVGLDVVDPLRKTFSLQMDEHVGEGPDVAGERVQFRTMGEYGRQDRAVLFGEIVGVSGDPARDSPSRGRSRAYRLWCGAHGADVGADRAVAAGVARRDRGGKRRAAG